MFVKIARLSSHVGTRWIRRLGATFVCVVLIMMATPAPAAADFPQPALADITLSPLTVNPQTGVGHFSVSVTCLAPLQLLVRAKTWLTQIHGQGRNASSFNVGAAFGCTAGQRLVLQMQFGNQQGSFAPGPATIYGFVEHFSPYPGVLGFASRTVLLHPEH